MNAAPLTKAQLEGLWIKAGGDPRHADVASAVALAESSGHADAINHNRNGSIDRGAWQINSIHGALSTTDALANARAAVRISHNGSDWTPWVTFKNGAYRGHLAPGTRPASTALVPAGAGGGGPGLFSSKASGLKYASVWIALVAAGAALALAGVNRAAGGAPARAAKTAAKTGAKAAVA